MQTLLSTAREVLKDPNLRLDDLLLPEVSIRAGAAPNNRWRLRQYPLNTSHHVDRFVRFFNAALADANGAPYRDAIPSFAARLRS